MRKIIITLFLLIGTIYGQTHGDVSLSKTILRNILQRMFVTKY